MTNLNQNIIGAIHSELSKSNELMMTQAYECVKKLQHNLSIKELGDHDAQVTRAIEYVKSIADEAVLDEVQGNVLRRFIEDDEQIEDLDVYDETCDLRSQYQTAINGDINVLIEDLEQHLTKYVVYYHYGDDDGYFIDNLDDPASAEAKIAEYSERYNESVDDYSIINVQLVNTTFTEADDDSDPLYPNYNVKVQAKIDDELCEADFYVQLLDGYHMPQMGCYLTASDGESGVFNAIENVLDECFGIAGLTEAHALAEIKDRVKFHGTGFNCFIGGNTVYIIEDTENNEFSLLVSNTTFSVLNYGRKNSDRFGRFETLKEAQEFCERFKTDEFYDFNGLNSLITHIQSDN